MRLIDADNVIEKIESAMKNFPLSDRRETSTGIRIALFDIKQMIEEQPTLNNWIPVSERLPNADEMSKCLYVNSCGAYMTEAYIYEVGGTYNCEDDYTILCDVVAWMPLPEPYKVGENDAGQV